MPTKKSKIGFAHNNLYFLDNRCKDKYDGSSNFDLLISYPNAF